MARYSTSVRTGAGSTTLPIISLYASATCRPRLKEVHLFNTTTTAVALKVVRLTTAGTAGAAIARMPLVPEDPAALATAFTTHTVAPTITTGDLWQAPLGAAIGSGIIITFPDPGLVIPMVANNGIGIVVSTGTGQVVDATLFWDEG